MKFRKPFEDTLKIFEERKDSTWNEEKSRRNGFIPDCYGATALLTTLSIKKVYPKAARFALSQPPLDKNKAALNPECIKFEKYEYDPDLFFFMEKTLGIVYGTEFEVYQLEDGRLFLQNYRGEVGTVCPILEFSIKNQEKRSEP